MVVAIVTARGQGTCDLSKFREVYGYYFDAGSGAMYNSRCELQPFTFENAMLFDFRLPEFGQVRRQEPPVRLSPIAFATMESTRQVLKVVEQIAPGSQPQIYEENLWACPGGPNYAGWDHVVICYTHPMRFIRVYPSFNNPIDGGKGWPISAGQAANLLMRNPTGARRILQEDIERGLGYLQRVNGF
jgi:hypothetical protein